MIVLDTNVLSEVLKPLPSDAVVRWLAAQESGAICITTITQAEILYGIESLPSGKRRLRLAAAVGKIFAEDFEERILPFDVESARAYPKIVRGREKAGHPISQFHAMIAAIATSRGAAVATRNTSDFEGCGIRVIDPWKDLRGRE